MNALFDTLKYIGSFLGLWKLSYVSIVPQFLYVFDADLRPLKLPRGKISAQKYARHLKSYYVELIFHFSRLIPWFIS